MTTDLLVVGAGPIGLGVAIEAARAGLSVAVLDPRQGPIDKSCGEGLMPAGRQAFARLGVQLDGMEFHGIRYVAGDLEATAPFRHGAGIGVRRTALSAALDQRSRELGITRIVGRASAPTVRAGVVSSGGHRARWLVAADGLHSPTRAWLGLAAPPDGPNQRRLRYGLRRHYRVAPWSPLVEVHWAQDAEAYVTPVAPELVGVAILCPGGEPYDAWLDRFPLLRKRLGAATGVGTARGAGPLMQVATGRVRGQCLLVGDAAGYVDALTGEGISVGLSCARALVGCLVQERPGDYEGAWHRATSRYRRTTTGLLRVAGSPPLRRLIVPAAHRLPGAFGAIVNSLG